jgi:hypothetical protein
MKFDFAGTNNSAAAKKIATSFARLLGPLIQLKKRTPRLPRS